MKKVLAILLTLTLVMSLFVGCKKEKPTGGDKPTETPTETPENPDDGGAEEVDLSEHVTLKMMLHGNNVSDDTAVLEKVNAILKEKLNVTLEPIWGTWGDFDNKQSMSIEAGDDIDIYFTSAWNDGVKYIPGAKRGAFVKLDDLIEKYAQDLFKLLPQPLTNGAFIIGDQGPGYYGVPGYKDIATQNAWDINVTLLEKYGYTLDDIKSRSYFEFGDILKTVKDGEGNNFYPLVVEGAVLERMVTNSAIVAGDALPNLFSFYMNPEDVSAETSYGNTILNKFATPEYKKFVEKTREYFLAGYIDPAMGITEQANDVRSAKQLEGKYLISTQSYAYGYEKETSALRGIHVEYVPVTAPYMDTTSTQGAIMAISTASQHPERALMFLNLLNTDAELMTLLAYGVEGTHYDMVNGEAIFTDVRKDTYSPWVNGIGNITLLPPQQDQGANFVNEFKEFYGSAKGLPIIGFAFDPTPVETEFQAAAAAANQYTLPLSVGAVDPATELPKLLKALEDNGFDKVLEEVNNQLASHLEASK